MSPAFPSVFHPGAWTAVDWVNHLWQSTVVGGGLLLLLALCGRLSARTRLGIGWLALGKFVLPVAAVAAAIRLFTGPSAPGLAAEMPPGTVPIFAPVSVAAVPAPPRRTAPLFPVSIPVSPAVATRTVQLWLAGVVVFGGFWLVRGIRAHRRLLAGAEDVPAPVRREISVVIALAGVKTAPRCVIGATGHGPALVGVFSPVVVLPRGLQDCLSAAEFRAVLLHEFVHLRRRDHLSEILRAACAGLLWFNPVVWLLNRRLHTDLEKACDERVVEITRDPDTYVSGIVKTVRHTLGLHEPAFAGVTTPPIIGRIKNVFAHEPRRDDPRLQFLAVAAAIVILAFSGYAGLIATAKAATPPAPVAAIAHEVAPSQTTSPTGPDIAANHVSITPGKEQRPIPRYQLNPQTGTVEVNGFISEKTATVDFIDEDIRTVVREIADYFELNVILPDTLQGRTTFKLSDGLWRPILKNILQPFDHGFAEEENIIKVARIETLPVAGTPKGSRFGIASASPKNTSAKDTLSIDFTDTEIREVIRRVADLFELNVVIPDTLKGKITLKLRDVTWRQIFQIALESAGYTFVETGGVLRIVGNEESMRTEVFALTKAKAADLVAALKPFVDAGAGGTVAVDTRSNSLVISERTSRLNRIRPIVEQLDRETQPTLASHSVEVVQLKRARVADIIARLRVEPDAGKLITNEVANTITIDADEPRAARIRQIIDQFDRTAATKPVGANSVESDRTVRNITPAPTIILPPGDSRQAYTFVPKTALTTDVVAKLRDLLVSPPGVTVNFDEPTNTILVVAIPADIARISQHIQQLDSEPASSPTAPTTPSGAFKPTPVDFSPLPTYQLFAGAENWQGNPVFNPSQLDVQPVPRSQPRPLYPFEMRRMGISGDVVVDMIIDLDGNVIEASPVRSSQREFEAPAVAAVLKWKFKPGRRGGRDVYTHLQVPVTFSLNSR